MQTKTFRVIREHIGDKGKLYSPNGEFNTREALPNDVAHLVPLTLELIVAEPETADAAPENKAEAAPETAAVTEAPARKGK